MYSITITCNHKNQQLQITFRLLKTCNQSHVIKITDYNYSRSAGGQKFILASSQWKISDIRMIDSSEFSEFKWGGNRNLYFAYASFSWFAAE